jgi:predicted amidohydrolase YtcJ
MSEASPTGASPQRVLAIVNARVWTADPRRPWADAVLVRGEIVVAVGASAELRKRSGAGALVIDAGGRMVLPTGSLLAPGEPADLTIVDRVVHDGALAAMGDVAVVFSLEKGCVVLDRDSLASGSN